MRIHGERQEGNDDAHHQPDKRQHEGVAGPDPDEGNPVGLVYIGIAFEGSVYAARFQFTGSREEIRRQAACEALALALGVVSE